MSPFYGGVNRNEHDLLYAVAEPSPALSLLQLPHLVTGNLATSGSPSTSFDRTRLSGLLDFSSLVGI